MRSLLMKLSLYAAAVDLTAAAATPSNAYTIDRARRQPDEAACFALGPEGVQPLVAPRRTDCATSAASTAH